jgi:hypothetical protein
VHFNISGAALDPQNPMPDGRLDAAGKAAYLASIVAAVALVEQQGMNVILTLQTGDVAGDPAEETTPKLAAPRAWQVLAPVFADDPAVILDAFNEPGYGGVATIDTDPSPWLAWQAGYGSLVDAIRAAGATNVIMLDGLSVSRVWRKLTPAQVPVDPLGQLAFDIHPYPTDATQLTKGGVPRLEYTSAADIDHWLDGWCDTHACMATEFFTGITTNPDAANCYDLVGPGPATTSPEITRAFANHLHALGVGVMAFPADWSNRLFVDPAAPSPVLTSFAGFVDCTGPKDQGPGAALRTLWTTGAVPTPVP